MVRLVILVAFSPFCVAHNAKGKVTRAAQRKYLGDVPEILTYSESGDRRQKVRRKCLECIN